MPDPELSVVVPVGRVDALLGEQLRALAGQTTDRAFLVVLACNDPVAAALGAAEAAASSAALTSGRVVAAWARRGPSHARNVGAAETTSELLAFCDADDVVGPGWVEAMALGLADDDAVGGHLEPFGASDEELGARPPATPGALPTFMGHPYALSANVGVRRAAFEEVGGFDESLQTCEDIALSWSLQVAGRSLGWAPSAAIAYRHRPGLRPMLAQHYRYGIGMSQLLERYGIPDGAGWAPAGGRVLRGNGQPGATSSWRSRARRGAIAAGRLRGLAGERLSPGRGRRRS